MSQYRYSYPDLPPVSNTTHQLPLLHSGYITYMTASPKATSSRLPSAFDVQHQPPISAHLSGWGPRQANPAADAGSPHHSASEGYHRSLSERSGYATARAQSMRPRGPGGPGPARGPQESWNWGFGWGACRRGSVGELRRAMMAAESSS